MLFGRVATIPNKGSIARDLMAAERTMLAWARTGLGFVGAGSGLFAAYHQGETSLRYDIVPSSAILIGNGGFLLVFCTRRYHYVIKSLQLDQFPLQTPFTAIALTVVSTISSLMLLARAEFQRSQLFRAEPREDDGLKQE